MENITVGPKTSRKEFFSEHIDLTRPEFKGMSEALKENDIATCEKIFARAMRQSPLADVYKKKRTEHIDALSERQKQNLIKNGQEAIDYTVCSCGIKYRFENKKIDWTFNPTYNGYYEWPWQLSRHAELETLASYYYLTGDEEAVSIYADYLQSWIRQAVVPEVGIGGVWGGKGQAFWTWRTIEAGIRLMKWPSHFNSLVTSPLISDSLICDYYTSVYEHGVRLYNDFTTFNWLIMEMHGLVKAALSAPFLKDSEKWYDFAVKKLTDEIDVQIYPDGFQAELSTGYHTCVESNYLAVFGTIKEFGREIPSALKNNLKRAFDIYVKLCRPSRRVPNLNDGSNDIILPRLKAALEYYPDCDTYRYLVSDGSEGTKPSFLSIGTEYSGVAIMRSNWSKNAVWAYMDCSPFGICHQHEDKLNVLLDAYGKTLLVDAGNFAYDNSDMRKYVISTRGHNTVLLDGKEQNRAKLYKRENLDINAKADMLFKTTESYDFASSKYNEGYGAELCDMKHSRKLIFVKSSEKYGLKPFFIVVDRFEAPDEEEHTYEQMWHMEECAYTQGDGYATGDFGDGVGLMIAFSDKNGKIVNMRGQHEPYYQGFMPIGMAPTQEEHRPINTPVLCGKFKGKRRVVTVLYPFDDGENKSIRVTASTDFDAGDVTLNTENGTFTLSESDF